jgi:hypothetical protein
MKTHRRILVGVAVLAMAEAVAACVGPVVLASPVGEAVERAGLHLEPASFLDVPAVTQEAAVGTARETMDANVVDGWLTQVMLVIVSGPGNPRLGWDPAKERLVYAVEWSDGTTVGLTLVSASTGEVLLVTAY